MNIEILIRPPMRRWQQRLIDKLRADGHQVRARPGAGRKRLALGVAPALAIERRLFGPAASLFAAMPLPDPQGGEPANLVIALDGETAPPDRGLELLFNDATGDAALLAMLSRGKPPVVRVRAYRQGVATDLVVARLAVEDRTILSRALDQVLARTVTLLIQAVRRFEMSDPLPSPHGEEPRSGVSNHEGLQEATVRDRLVVRDGPDGPPRHEANERGVGSGRVLPVIARGLARKVASRLPGAKRGPNHWRIGYRRLTGAGVADTRVWPTEAFTILPDDGARFYADPMPFEHEGRTYLFFEDFPYGSAKGVIGLVEIAADGTASGPRTVLELPCHLSYPLIIAQGGEIYMLPEMSAAHRLQLFRADPFPDRWVPDRVLLDGIVAADATPIRHDGLWWLFATLADDGGSSWDQLGLFHAKDLLGPWTAQADNPVLVDAGAARPAGAMWHEGGTLMRVAQDCRGGYGVGLAICRVDRLDRDGYAQTVVARLEAPVGTESDGVHTLNRAGPLEVIDLRHLRRPAVRRAPGRD